MLLMYHVKSSPVLVQASLPLCQYSNLVDLQTVFDESPCTIHHLRSRLHSKLAAIRERVLCDAHKGWRLPNPFPAFPHTFLLMDHGVMEHPCHLGLVAPSAIGVEYDVAALESGLGNLRPMHLLDSAWAWRPLACGHAGQSDQYQRGWLTAGDHTQPPLPLHHSALHR